MADEYDIQQSLEHQGEEFLMQNRTFAYVNDSNNGSYNGSSQITIDCSGIANSGKYMSFQQSFLQIPLVMTLAANVGNLNNITGENAFAASLKNSYTTLIHSLNAEISNNSVVATTSYTNMAINYTLLTTMSAEDEKNLGSTIGFAKDDVLSSRYVAGANSLFGLGEINNIITRPLFDPNLGFGLSMHSNNSGRLARMMNNTAYDPLMRTSETIQHVISSGKNYNQRDALTVNPGLNTGAVVNYYITATIPLSILSDLFKKMPLVKGSYLKLVLNLNTGCSTTLTMNGNTYTSVVSSSPNNCVPYQISPCATLQGFNNAGNVACTSATLSIGVARYTFTPVTYNHPSLSSCRLYCCLYDLSPSCESMYLAKMPTKRVKYEDIISFQSLSIPANGTFSQILTNGLSRVRKLVGVTQIASSFNNAGLAGTIAPMNSPFSTAPATCSNTAITNFNVLLSGVQLYSQNYSLSAEHFFQELRKMNSVNGGSTLGLSSGLISQSDFENGYRFITADLSRKPSEAVDNVAKSIQVLGTNASNFPIDIYWFVFYEREITIDIQTGQLIA